MKEAVGTVLGKCSPCRKGGRESWRRPLEHIGASYFHGGRARSTMRDILGTENNFKSLSLKDLLAARDLYHFHLMNKANVVGTAVGLYLIRNSDEYPSREDFRRVKSVQRTGDKPP